VRFSKTIIAATAVIGMGLSVSTALADADETIKARQACMKANGAMMGVLVPMMKGEKPYDAAAAKAAMDSMGGSCSTWDTFWSEESIKGGTIKHYAKAEILSDPEGFKKASGDSYTAMQALMASTDEASFKAAFPGVGAGCQGCHEKFRAPKE
jgi:cytochrome c556